MKEKKGLILLSSSIGVFEHSFLYNAFYNEII